MVSGTKITSKMVAEKAGVSQTAVSFVLNGDPEGKISNETKRRIRKAMRELGYRPNLLARSMRTQKTMTIGIVTAGIATGWFTKVVTGAEEVLREEDYNILLGSISLGSSKARTMRASIDLLLSRQVDGLIVITGSENQDEEALADLIDSGVPTVTVNHYSDKVLPFGRVFVGYQEAAVEAVNHLYKIGRRRIAYLGENAFGDKSTGFTRDIYKGYLKGLKQLGLPIDRELIRFWPGEEVQQSYEWGIEVAPEILRMRPDAIYCITDFVAFGFLEYCRESGIKVPGEIAVVGNDNLDPSRFVVPPLTSMDMCLEKCGEISARVLLDILEGNSAVTIKGPIKLVPRGSTIGLERHNVNRAL